jgi:xanthine dehydrogenase molybdopterin-binding subunit B
MSALTAQARQLDKINRAERLLATIATLEEQIKSISASGEVAPKGCYLARYQARGQYKAYWYYKLQAKQPMFTSKKGQGKPSRYKHLGAAGTEAHVDGVLMVIRRVQIDELQKSIDALRDSWSDLYFDISEQSDSH